MESRHFEHFAQVIRSLTAVELAGAPSRNAKMALASDGDIEVCYAPFEYINSQAKVVIVGITLGRTQMLNALKGVRKQIDRGETPKTRLQPQNAQRPSLELCVQIWSASWTAWA